MDKLESFSAAPNGAATLPVAPPKRTTDTKAPAACSSGSGVRWSNRNIFFRFESAATTIAYGGVELLSLGRNQDGQRPVQAIQGLWSFPSPPLPSRLAA